MKEHTVFGIWGTEPSSSGWITRGAAERGSFPSPAGKGLDSGLEAVGSPGDFQTNTFFKVVSVPSLEYRLESGERPETVSPEEAPNTAGRAGWAGWEHRARYTRPRLKSSLCLG